MPVVGVEPTRVISTRDFESPSSAIPTHRLICNQKNATIIADSAHKIKTEFPAETCGLFPGSRRPENCTPQFASLCAAQYGV